MVTSPEADLADLTDVSVVEEVAEDTRYALQRSRAARRGQLPSRLLLNRARTEGEAHRRLEESTDNESPFSHPSVSESWD